MVCRRRYAHSTSERSAAGSSSSAAASGRPRRRTRRRGTAAASRSAHVARPRRAFPRQRLPHEPRVCDHERRREERDRDAVRHPELLEPMRQRPPRLVVRVARQRPERVQPPRSVTREREAGDGRRRRSRSRGDRRVGAARVPRAREAATARAGSTSRSTLNAQQTPASCRLPAAAAASAPTTSSATHASLCPPPAKCTASSGFHPTNARARAGRRDSRAASAAAASTRDGSERLVDPRGRIGGRARGAGERLRGKRERRPVDGRRIAPVGARSKRKAGSFGNSSGSARYGFAS